MNSIFRFLAIIVCILLLVGCSNEAESSNTEKETEEVNNEEEKEEETIDQIEENADDDDEKEETEEEVFLTEKELYEQVEEQPLKVISKNYLVQDDEHKTLYPDMLQVIIENNSGEDIIDAVIAFSAWDENGLPLKIEADFSLNSRFK